MKKVVAGLLASVMLFSLAACGGSGGNKAYDPCNFLKNEVVLMDSSDFEKKYSDFSLSDEHVLCDAAYRATGIDLYEKDADATVTFEYDTVNAEYRIYFENGDAENMVNLYFQIVSDLEKDFGGSHDQWSSDKSTEDFSREGLISLIESGESSDTIWASWNDNGIDTAIHFFSEDLLSQSYSDLGFKNYISINFGETSQQEQINKLVPYDMHNLRACIGMDEDRFTWYYEGLTKKIDDDTYAISSLGDSYSVDYPNVEPATFIMIKDGMVDSVMYGYYSENISDLVEIYEKLHIDIEENCGQSNASREIDGVLVTVGEIEDMPIVEFLESPYGERRYEASSWEYDGINTRLMISAKYGTTPASVLVSFSETQE